MGTRLNWSKWWRIFYAASQISFVGVGEHQLCQMTILQSWRFNLAVFDAVPVYIQILPNYLRVICVPRSPTSRHSSSTRFFFSRGYNLTTRVCSVDRYSTSKIEGQYAFLFTMLCLWNERHSGQFSECLMGHKFGSTKTAFEIMKCDGSKEQDWLGSKDLSSIWWSPSHSIIERMAGFTGGGATNGNLRLVTAGHRTAGRSGSAVRVSVFSCSASTYCCCVSCCCVTVYSDA